MGEKANKSEISRVMAVLGSRGGKKTTQAQTEARQKNTEKARAERARKRKEQAEK